MLPSQLFTESLHPFDSVQHWKAHESLQSVLFLEHEPQHRRPNLLHFSTQIQTFAATGQPPTPQKDQSYRLLWCQASSSKEQAFWTLTKFAFLFSAQAVKAFVRLCTMLSFCPLGIQKKLWYSYYTAPCDLNIFSFLVCEIAFIDINLMLLWSIHTTFVHYIWKRFRIQNSRQEFTRHKIYFSSPNPMSWHTFSPFEETSVICLEDSLGWSHGAFDVECPDILPVLLQQGHQEVDGQRDVGVQLIWGHGHMPNTGRQTQNLNKIINKSDQCWRTRPTELASGIEKEANSSSKTKQKCGQNKKYNPKSLLSNPSQTGTSVTFHLFQQFKCMQDWSRNQSTAFKETWKQNFHLEAGDHHYHMGMWTTSECKRVLSKGLDNTCQFI